ncbi:hypothetical protein N7493_006578 [Penicillium malachiteum]|uniref:Major facilitator superfamily (MFS) profile domain-containing protein n=1 Tax=Penicillium malachiteum TaxID=1324776 RepID=A0AAD6HLP1_9EURO|nr:hypothetical protein N7493_006578 [Penicillium malachiteum]
MGTVKLTEGSIVYIPTPTAEPWGFGGVISFYIEEYVAAGKTTAQISPLMTYPTLFMGIGNLIGMPAAIAVGRRIVILASTLILIVGAVLCATAKSYEWHLGARMLLGLCAGQSEALVPMITQEIFFLHERSRGLMLQQAIQVSLTTVWVLFASPIAGAITPKGWYALGVGLTGLEFFVAIFLLPETKYSHELNAFPESGSDDSLTNQMDLEADQPVKSTVMVCKEKPPLDFVNYEARTWRSDMRLWIGTSEWHKAAIVLQQTFELPLFPNVFWALCLNGLTIGVNIAIGTTYGDILTGTPYYWPDSSTSYVNCGQIVVAIIGLPLLGHGSDALCRWRARRNEGMHEPETRIILLFFPIIVGTFTAVLYGQGAAHPFHYHWFTHVWEVAAYYSAFIGANIVAITYLLDSYPARAGPLLVILCAFRGFISFGTSYGTTSFVSNNGYDGAFGIFGGLTGFFGLLGLPIYIWGKNIRQFMGRFAKGQTD